MVYVPIIVHTDGSLSSLLGIIIGYGLAFGLIILYIGIDSLRQDLKYKSNKKSSYKTIIFGSSIIISGIIGLLLVLQTLK